MHLSDAPDLPEQLLANVGSPLAHQLLACDSVACWTLTHFLRIRTACDCDSTGGRDISKPARANNESGSLITQFVKRLPLSLLALAGLERFLRISQVKSFCTPQP